MTNTEAIQRIINHNEIHSRKEKHFAIYITEALNIAVEALKKQIPKKLNETEAYPHRLFCPKCFFTLAFNKDNADFIKSNQMYNYCPACGQALDWGEDKCTTT